MLKAFQELTNLVFPQVCVGCDRPLLKSEESICLYCLNRLPERLTLKNEDLKQRFYGRLQLDEAHAFLLFKRKGVTQKLLHALKYNGNQSLGQSLGSLFGTRCLELSLFSSVDVVVPIPLHISKLRYRGFNQSALIAEGFSNAMGIQLDTGSVVRKVKTTTQTKKSRTERWKNVDGTFQVISENLKGKHVLLMDDVITTGATLESCGHAVLSAGVSKISLACLAMA